jgi:hypothetical protein
MPSGRTRRLSFDAAAQAEHVARWQLPQRRRAPWLQPTFDRLRANVSPGTIGAGAGKQHHIARANAGKRQDRTFHRFGIAQL